MPTRSLADALADSPARPLFERLARIQRVSRALAEAVAPLVPDFDPQDPLAVELKESVLILNARSAAQAAKLRQGSPGVLRHLQKNGAQVTEIRVRVQPARTSYPERANDGTQVPPRGEVGASAAAIAAAKARAPTVVAGAEHLARTLVDSLPDSPLRRAAQRLRSALEHTGDRQPPSGPPGRRG